MRACKGKAATRGLVSLALLAAVGLFSARGAAPGSGCGSMVPREIYEKCKRETMSLSTYKAVYYHATERGADHEVYARLRAMGRYRREPARWREKRLDMESSFPEQAGAGFQERYSADDDMTRVLMPGALRIIGVIPMYPEDPKADYINGENLKQASVWTWFPGWDRMLEGGRIDARCAERDGRPFWVLTIDRGRIPDPLYHHDRAMLWIDIDTWFPMRIEDYRSGDPRPVSVYDFEEVELNPALDDDDFEFEGLSFGWNLAPVPEGPGLASIEREEPELGPEKGLDAKKFMAVLDKALAGLDDYRTTMTMKVRYHRLRQLKTEEFMWLASGAFSSRTVSLQANYVQLNAGEDFCTVYDPDGDGLIHVVPAGVYRITGEQTFPIDDPRIFTALGDNVMDLNFRSIREGLAARLSSARRVSTAAGTWGGVKVLWIEVAEKELGIPKRPTIMRVALDRETGLPAMIEYGGYDDPEGFLSVSFTGTRINTGIEVEDLRED